MEKLNQNICFAALLGEAFITSGGGRQEISNILDSTEKKIALISNVWKDYWFHSSSRRNAELALCRCTQISELQKIHLILKAKSRYESMFLQDSVHLNFIWRSYIIWKRPNCGCLFARLSGMNRLSGSIYIKSCGHSCTYELKIWTIECSHL